MAAAARRPVVGGTGGPMVSEPSVPAAAAAAAHEPSKKVSLIKEVHQLEVKIQSMSKEKEICLYRKADRKDYAELQELEKLQLSDFKADKLKIKKELAHLKGLVSSFHSELRHMAPSPQFLEKIKIIMEEIEAAITGFKESQRKAFEELMTSERLLSQELPALEKRFDGWLLASQASNAAQSEGKAAGVPSQLPSARDVTKELPPEVAALQHFLQQTGGSQGGWDDYDHGTFMKYRTKHKGKPAFLAELASIMLTKTEEQIRQHEDWYQEYMALTEKKKAAIQLWRLQKQAQREEVVAQVAEEDDDERKQRRQLELKLAAEREKERHEQMQRLSAWKVQRELQKAEEDEARLRAELDKAKKERAERARLEESKQKVEDYRREKQAEEEAAQLAEEARRRQEEEERRARLSRDVGRIGLRNELILASKLDKLKAKEREQQEKDERLQRLKGQVEVHVERDPKRLLKPTAVWTQRARQCGPSELAGRVYSAPQRAIPSWRQGL